MDAVEPKSIVRDDRAVASTERTRLTVDERRAQLLELGLRLFGDKAYDEVSIDEIARAAGVSKGLLYHYFGGKRAYYVACVEAAAEQLFVRTEADASLPEPLRARAGIDAYFDYAEEHEGAYLALMRSGVGSDPEVAGVVERTRGRIVDRALESMGMTEMRPVFRAATRSWIGAVEAACLDYLDHRDVEREAVVQILLASLYATVVAAAELDPDAPLVIGPTPTE